MAAQVHMYDHTNVTNSYAKAGHVNIADSGFTHLPLPLGIV